MYNSQFFIILAVVDSREIKLTGSIDGRQIVRGIIECCSGVHIGGRAAKRITMRTAKRVWMHDGGS